MCDPVLGDNGRLYVPKALIPIYQNEIIPLCDICTPNQFEAELLTGVTVESGADAWNALNWFHEKGVKTVVLSSTNIGPENFLTAFLSHKNGMFSIRKFSFPFGALKSHYLFDTGDEEHQIILEIPVVGDGIQFTGVGDLFASLFLSHTASKSSLNEALEYTIATLQAVLHNTINAIPKGLFISFPLHVLKMSLTLVRSQSIIDLCSIFFQTENRFPDKVTPRQRELKIIQSKRDIENPDVVLRSHSMIF